MSDCFIIDTNIVVAGLLTTHADSPVACTLEGMINAAFPFVVSESLLAEYHLVLVRPKLRQLHGLSESEIEFILTDIARHAVVLAPVRTAATPIAPDPGDQFLWDLLAVRSDLVLVTGDKLLLQDEAMRERVILPKTLAARLQR